MSPRGDTTPATVTDLLKRIPSGLRANGKVVDHAVALETWGMLKYEYSPLGLKRVLTLEGATALKSQWMFTAIALRDEAGIDLVGLAIGLAASNGTSAQAEQVEPSPSSAEPTEQSTSVPAGTVTDDAVPAAPSEPMVSEPVPSEPVPSEPTSSEPMVSEPVPSEPTLSEPVQLRTDEHDTRELRLSGLTDASIIANGLSTTSNIKAVEKTLGMQRRPLASQHFVLNGKLVKLAPGEFRATAFPIHRPGADRPYTARFKFQVPRLKTKWNKQTRKIEFVRDDAGLYEIIKYEAPPTSVQPRCAVFYGARSRDLALLKNALLLIIFTEGEKKSIALELCGFVVIGLTGIGNWTDSAASKEWRAKHPKSKRRHILHPDIAQYVDFRGRRVLIFFDFYKHKVDPDEPKRARALATVLRDDHGAAEVLFVTGPSADLKGADDLFRDLAQRAGQAQDLSVDCAISLDLEQGKARMLEYIEQHAEVLLRAAPDAVPGDAVPGDADADELDLPKLGDDTMPVGVDPYTGLAQANRLARCFGHVLRHDGGQGWMVFDGRVWARDEKAATLCAIKVSRAMVMRAEDQLREQRKELREAEEAKGKDRDEECIKDLKREIKVCQAVLEFAVKQQEHRALDTVLKIASALPPIATTVDVWDRDPWLFNLANGTLDLRSRELRHHHHADLITQISPVSFDPEATAPLWEKFQSEVHPDAEIRAFNQRHYGYSLTGVTREHVLIVCYGAGRNGKSTETETVREVFGTYAGEAAGGTFVAGWQNGRSSDNKLAKLRGTRLVTTSESAEGHALNEDLVKRVTGGDPVTANLLYEEPFEYHPTYKLRLTTNHRPEIRGLEDAIWARLKLIPYAVSFLGRENTELTTQLKAEAPGILNWLLHGCAEWQRQGLSPPVAVQNSTSEWRADANELLEFIGDRCITAPYAKRAIGDLYAAYRSWAESQGREHPMSKGTFGRRLTESGYPPVRSAESRFRTGIDLKESHQAEDGLTDPGGPGHPVGRGRGMTHDA